MSPDTEDSLLHHQTVARQMQEGEDQDTEIHDEGDQSTSDPNKADEIKPGVSCPHTDSTDDVPRIVRIATWAQVAPDIQKLINAYHDKVSYDPNGRQRPQIELQVFPSIRDLGVELMLDIRFQTQHYDGMVVPPIFMGDLFAEQGLLELDDLLRLPEPYLDEDDDGQLADSSETENTQQFEAWKDILPIYRNILATFGGDTIQVSPSSGSDEDDNEAVVDASEDELLRLQFSHRIRLLPMLGGNQLTLWYRKDWLEQYNLQPPRTWSDYVRVAATLHGEQLGPDGTSIVGSCLGRYSLEACRQETDRHRHASCQSLSMSYLGMMISSVTQADGSSSGWLFDSQEQQLSSNANKPKSRTILKPLLQATFETVLSLMEQQIRFGAPQELRHDASINGEMFRNGTCALTISAETPLEMISDVNRDVVGVAAIPGSHQFLKDRVAAMVDTVGGSVLLDNCTPAECPFGLEDEEFGIINQVPFGSVTDLAMGGVSSLVSPQRQNEVKDFFEHVLSNAPFELDGMPARDPTQPLRFSELLEFPLTASSSSESTTNEGNDGSVMSAYSKLIRSSTASRQSLNSAIPLRIPEAFDLWSELDNRVFEYLLSEDYSLDGRQRVRQDVERQWTAIMEAHDGLFGAVPLNTFYQKSLGVYVPEPPEDLYIGDILRFTGWGMGAVCLLTSLFMAVWVKYYINERPVVGSQPMYLWTICAGTFIMACSIFPFGFEDSIVPVGYADSGCMAAVWFYAIGLSLTFAALHSKTARINRTYRLAHNFQRIEVEPKDILIPLLVVLPLNVIVLLAWSIREPMRWKRLPLEDGLEDQFDVSRQREAIIDETQLGLELSEPGTFGTCTGPNSLYYFASLFWINVISSLITAIQAYEIRKVSTEYNESVWIAAILGCLLQSWVLGLSVLSLLDDNPATKFVIKTIVVFCTCMVTLLLIFIPKFGYLRKAWAADQMVREKAFAAEIMKQREKYEKEKEFEREQEKKRKMGHLVPEEATNRSVTEHPMEASKQPVVPAIEPTLPGIRITTTRSRRSAEVQNIKEEVARSDERNRVLFERLERLQDTLASQRFDSQMGPFGENK